MLIFILIINLISMIPYSFALSSHIVLTVSLSITIWFGVTIVGLSTHQWKFFNLFVPSACPLILVPLLAVIVLFSYLARAISVGLRLTANVLSAHLLLAILSNLVFTLMSISLVYFALGFLPLIGILGIVILEYGISLIQGYVCCILPSSYIKDFFVSSLSFLLSFLWAISKWK